MTTPRPAATPLARGELCSLYLVTPTPGPRGIVKFRGWYQVVVHCPAGTYLPLPRPLRVHPFASEGDFRTAMIGLNTCHCERNEAIHKTTPRPAGTPLARGELSPRKISAPTAHSIALCSLLFAL